MIQSPKNYYFVGSDLSSTSWLISGLIGDSLMNKIHGSTYFSKYNYLQKDCLNLSKENAEVNKY